MSKNIKIFEDFDSMNNVTDYRSSRNISDNKGIELFKDWYESLSDDEINIIEWYRDSGYNKIAKLLFDLDHVELGMSKSKVLSNISKLKKILDKSKITEDITVYKGLSKGKLRDIVLKSNVDDIIKFPNFISTSLDYQYAIFGFTDMYSERIILRIKVPVGTSSAFVSFDYAESEILINKNKKIKILDIYKKNLKDIGHPEKDIIIYDCEIVK